jgi:hypothetical protein
MKLRIEFTLKNILRIILGSVTAIFLTYCTVIFFINPETARFTDCGKIISKSSDEVAIKHGTQTELYLNIQFEKSGFKAINVAPTDYFHYKKGENICFDLAEEDQIFGRLTWIIGAINLVLGGFIILFAFLNYLFTE